MDSTKKRFRPQSKSNSSRRLAMARPLIPRRSFVSLSNWLTNENYVDPLQDAVCRNHRHRRDYGERFGLRTDPTVRRSDSGSNRGTGTRTERDDGRLYATRRNVHPKPGTRSRTRNAAQGRQIFSWKTRTLQGARTGCVLQ